MPPDPDAARRRFGLWAEVLPFASRFVDAGGARLHHVDEGSSSVLVMLHGNPAWCVRYRHVIAALSPQFRSIAIDLPGFGLSEPPPDFG